MRKTTRSRKPSFSSALAFWAKLGCISFGGPAGQISIMHQEVVERRKWISESEYMHGLNYCMLLPGPEAQQLATYIGWRLHGIRGALAAGGLFILPSYFLFLLLGWLYMSKGNLAFVIGFFNGVKPAMVAIILYAVYKIGRKVMKTRLHYALAAIALGAVGLLKLSFLWVVLVGALTGWRQHKKSRRRQSPRPRMRIPYRRLARILLIGLCLWAAVMLLVLHLYGSDDDFARMSVFFSKAALVTFGGAYAVLPYVFQRTVEYYQWLTLPQMLDGLALGETTPGPLIMVVAFVSFVGGWNNAELHDISPFVGGVIGASIATFFTFLPSFIFILIGAPFIPHLKKMPVATAMLSYITAAVVGTIAYLGLFSAWHIFLPAGMKGMPDFLAILVAALSFLLIARYKISLPLLVFLTGATGLLVGLAF